MQQLQLTIYCESIYYNDFGKVLKKTNAPTQILKSKK